MSYALTTPLLEVKGIGAKTAADLASRGLVLVRDLVLNLPLHYLDRSTLGKIQDLSGEKEITFIAEVTSLSNFYRRPRSIQTATVKDDTGRIKLIWFNNAFILKKMAKGRSYVFSGKLSATGTVVQPVVAGLGEDSLHTGRIVPVYSGAFGLKIGTLRRIYREVLTNLQIPINHDLSQILPTEGLPPLHDALRHLHFPESVDQVVSGKERLALEELLVLIQRSNYIRQQWQQLSQTKPALKIKVAKSAQLPDSIPYRLTVAQQRCVSELLADLEKSVPMNRLLIGDVGSGKTVVAGIAAYHLAQAGAVTALVAPTKILASQHAETLRSLFPQLEIQLLSPKSKPAFKAGGIVVGTHRVINQLAAFRPALIVFDEQHRFGVVHRSQSQNLPTSPHVLTMTATPIPRTLMLTIFTHLQLSVIDEMPPGRLPVETFFTTPRKKADFYRWIEKILAEGARRQVLIVCPFIEASETEGYENIANVEDTFKEVEPLFQGKLVVGKLHARLKKTEQDQVIAELFAGRIQVLVTTPIIEVGVDLPTATVVAIYNAERFGLASLHQIRGRVGRRGEQGYCVLFSATQTATTKARLKMFISEHQGMKLAEYDLAHRGAGDIFGLAQSGEDGLRFANWTNLELISRARKIYNNLNQELWQPLLDEQAGRDGDLPLAN